MTGSREDTERELFGTVFLLAESWKHLLDNLLKPEGLSAKQWMLLASIEALGPEAPTLGQAAALYGTSRQSVKQLALRLERKGFLEMRPDPTDRRSLRLHLTPRHHEFWTSRAAEHQVQFAVLFEAVQTDALLEATGALQRLLARANETRQAQMKMPRDVPATKTT